MEVKEVIGKLSQWDGMKFPGYKYRGSPTHETLVQYTMGEWLTLYIIHIRNTYSISYANRDLIEDAKANYFQIEQQLFNKVYTDEDSNIIFKCDTLNLTIVLINLEFDDNETELSGVGFAQIDHGTHKDIWKFHMSWSHSSYDGYSTYPVSIYEFENMEELDISIGSAYYAKISNKLDMTLLNCLSVLDDPNFSVYIGDSDLVTLDGNKFLLNDVETKFENIMFQKCKIKFTPEKNFIL